jgi:DNA-binding NtrC family response regulator
MPLGGLRYLSESTPDLILLDQQLPDRTGLDLLKQIREGQPELPVIMMTGKHDLELAIEAIKQGATDFIHKPIDDAALNRTVSKALENRRLSRETTADVRPLDEAPSSELIGRSSAMLAISKEIALCAGSDANVLITGESGTGKEVVARLIHQHSGKSGPFVAVNCAAMVDTLLESELFGHERGAFTGAVERKQGRFELAEDGTLFLDEIGELALALQAKLLRTLQERVIERVGGVRPIPINARVIAATNRDLDQEVRAGRFREDLAYRLRVIAMRVPALRERREDIPLLVAGLMARIAPRIQRPALKVGPQIMERLQSHDWPGNVRELENLLTQAMVQARSPVLTPDLLPEPLSAPPVESPAPPDVRLKTLEEVEAEHVQRVLEHTRGHKGRACALLGISRPALDRKIRKFGLRLPAKD